MIFSQKIDKLKRLAAMPLDDIKQLGKFAHFIVFQFKVWPLCIKLLKSNRADQQAAALAYHTIFGFVPIVIMALIIFQSFPGSEGVGVKFRDMIYESVQLNKFEYPDPNDPETNIALTDYVDDLVGGFFENSGKGSAALLSGIFIFWAAVKLLSTIERTFNNIWNVSNGRGILMRIFYYWTPLTLGPLLIGAAIYIKTLDIITKNVGSFIPIFNSLSTWLIPIVAFFLLYWSMPNTKVKPLPALWAAIVAAVIWILLKNLYGFYIVRYMPFRELYGILGLIPLTILWIFISWQVVLFGVQLSYTIQDLEKIEEVEAAATDNSENFSIAGADTIIAIMGCISENFDAGKPPITGEKIARRLSLPYKLVYHILGRLVKSGLLVVSFQPSEGYCLARSSQKIKISEIRALDIDHRIDSYTDNCEPLRNASAEYEDKLSKLSLADISINEDV